MMRASGRGRAGAAPGSLWLAVGLLGVVWLTTSACESEKAPQAPAAGRDAPAASLPLPEPRLEHLEPEVQRQLSAERNRLAVSRTRLAEPELGRAYGRLGELYLAYDLGSAAETCLEIAAQLDSTEPRWTYYRALVASGAADLDTAARYLTSFLRQRPDYAAAWVLLGERRLQQARFDEASTAFHKALAIDRSNVPARYLLGQIAAQSGRHESAAQYFEAALKIQPAASVIRYPLAAEYQKLGRDEEARAQLALRGPRRPVLADPLSRRLTEITTGARGHLSRGSQAMRRRNLALAISEFGAAVEAAPDNPSARLNLGAALAQAGRAQRAIEELEAALDLGLDADGRSKTHFNLGALYRMQGRRDRAAEHLRQALHWDPDNRAAEAMLSSLEASSP